MKEGKTVSALKIHQKQLAIGLALLCAVAAVFCLALYSYAADEPSAASLDYASSPQVTLPGSTAEEKNGQYYGSAAELAKNYTNTYIVVKHKQLGASHYAYTEGVSDDFTAGYPSNEAQFRYGASLVKLTLTPNGTGVTTKEEVLLNKARRCHPRSGRLPRRENGGFLHEGEPKRRRFSPVSLSFGYR